MNVGAFIIEKFSELQDKYDIAKKVADLFDNRIDNDLKVRIENIIKKTETLKYDDTRRLKKYGVVLYSFEVFRSLHYKNLDFGGFCVGSIFYIVKNLNGEYLDSFIIIERSGFDTTPSYYITDTKFSYLVEISSMSREQKIERYIDKIDSLTLRKMFERSGFPFIEDMNKLDDEELKENMKSLLYEDYAYVESAKRKIEKKAKEISIE